MSEQTQATQATPASQETETELRARVELADLRLRIIKLELFISKGEGVDKLTLNFLKTQLSAMLAYEVALSQRIE